MEQIMENILDTFTKQFTKREFKKEYKSFEDYILVAYRNFLNDVKSELLTKYLDLNIDVKNSTDNTFACMFINGIDSHKRNFNYDFSLYISEKEYQPNIVFLVEVSYSKESTRYLHNFRFNDLTIDVVVKDFEKYYIGY